MDRPKSRRKKKKVAESSGEEEGLMSEDDEGQSSRAMKEKKETKPKIRATKSKKAARERAEQYTSENIETSCKFSDQFNQIVEFNDLQLYRLPLFNLKCSVHLRLTSFVIYHFLIYHFLIYHFLIYHFLIYPSFVPFIDVDDPILALIGRSCVTIVDRKEWREYLSKAVVEIIDIVEPIERKRFNFDQEIGHDDGTNASQNDSDISQNMSIQSQNHNKDDSNYDEDHNKQFENLPLRARVCHFISQLMRCGKTGLRTISLDICLGLLESSLSQLPPSIHDLQCQLLLSMVSRIHDVQQGIRARSLECLSALMLHKKDDISGTLEVSRLGQLLFGSLLSSIRNTEESQISNGQNDSRISIDIPRIIRERVLDDKQIVRKSALTLITAVAEVMSHFYQTVSQSGTSQSGISQIKFDQALYDLGIGDPCVLRSLCMDTSLQVRVKALSTVHTLLGQLSKFRFHPKFVWKLKIVCV